MFEISETNASTTTQIVDNIVNKSVCAFATDLNKVGELVYVLVQLVKLAKVLLIIDQMG